MSDTEITELTGEEAVIPFRERRRALEARLLQARAASIGPSDGSTVESVEELEAAIAECDAEIERYSE